MSKVQLLRAFVHQRLTAAAEEIFGLFERTIAEHEEELCRSKEENERHRKLLDAVFKPEVRLHRAVRPADVQQLSLVKEEVPPEDCSPSLHQEDPPEPPHVKEELWTGQEGEQLRGPEEADITKFTFSPVPVKSEEDDEEKAQSSQLHQNQTEQMETRGPEPARNSDPDTHLEPETEDSSETDDSDEDWTETREPQSGSKSHNNKVPVSHVAPAGGEKQLLLHSCSECGKRFGNKTSLKIHMRIHTGENSFSCLVCGKIFAQGANLRQHMAVHAGRERLSCSVCDRRFTWYKQFTTHKCAGPVPSQQTETGGPEPARNSDRRLDPGTLDSSETEDSDETRDPQSRLKSVRHKNVPVRRRTPFTGERPFSCSVCGRRFRRRGNMKEHMRSHVKEISQVDRGTQICTLHDDTSRMLSVELPPGDVTAD